MGMIAIYSSTDMLSFLTKQAHRIYCICNDRGPQPLWMSDVDIFTYSTLYQEIKHCNHKFP